MRSITMMCPYFGAHIMCAVWIILISVNKSVVGLYPGGQCDQNVGSGATVYQQVTEVKVDCREGHVTWRAPYGALRITMQLGRGNGGQFEGCFIATTSAAKAKISLEDPLNKKDDLKLIPLVILNETNFRTRKEICLQSRQSELVLYIEVEPNSKTRTMGKVHLDYDLKRIYKNRPTHTINNMEECKPCSEKEILNAFCSSDFVVIGSIDTVNHDTDLEETSMNLSIDKVVRQKTSRFKRHMAAGRRYVGAVVAPRKCGITHGPGQFMFTGRIRLGKSLLQCAPFLEEWEEIKRSSVKKGVHPCNLEY